jgi:hypothetical protein
VRADCFSASLCEVQFCRECFLAGVAEELVVGHTGFPESLTDSIWILDPRLEQVQHFNIPSGKPIQRTLLANGRRQLKKFCDYFSGVDMTASAQFYRNVLGMELLYGGTGAILFTISKRFRICAP